MHGTYYRFIVEKPVRQILDATHRITNGDFKVRIEPIHVLGKRNELDIIIDNFNKMAEELSSIETLRTDFISNVSHELKTPLSIIQNYAALMQDENTTDLERKEYSKSIYETSQNISKLVTNILKLNRLENQKIFLETKSYNLSNQLAECLLSFEHIWENKNIDIKVDIDENIMLNADEELTSIIWNNLYSNAFKFTEANGTVSVQAKSNKNSIIVSVSDTGCGMNKETGKHIFEKFYQGDTSHATKGNGLGLALVKRIIDIMNADIYIESSLGKGTTFTVKLDTQKMKNI
ncbi:HAMP domain-containing sensor histidine kinase [Intestinibacter sp.]